MKYLTEGHRLLVESDYSGAEACRLTGLRRQAIFKYRKGECTPDKAARHALEAAGIPVETWDQAPKAPGSAKTVPRSGPAQASEEGEEAPLGLAAIARLIAEIEASAADMPPKDRAEALNKAGRLAATHETMRLSATSAEQEYLKSQKFRDVCRTLLAAFPTSEPELRVALARVGVFLSEPTKYAPATDQQPPEDETDLLELIKELRVVKELHDGGESGMAWAHLQGLCVDLHATQIADVVCAYPAHELELLSLLEGPDRAIVASELERKRAMAAVRELPTAARDVCYRALKAYQVAL